jgi:hypothetical protein
VNGRTSTTLRPRCAQSTASSGANTI